MKISVILLIVLIISCGSPRKEPITIFCNQSAQSIKIETVSLNDKKKIEKLNGKFIQIEGVFNYYSENVALFPSSEFQPQNAIWLNLLIPDSISSKKIDSINSKKIVVIGRVNTRRNGHMNEYFAELDSVFCLKVF